MNLGAPEGAARQCRRRDSDQIVCSANEYFVMRVEDTVGDVVVADRLLNESIESKPNVAGTYNELRRLNFRDLRVCTFTKISTHVSRL